ncbi:MAG: hypothetical protein KC496_13040, partial [Anaerolineae bacterium]|nr:hypothetical protein [Anaerolineae bacterium]
MSDSSIRKLHEINVEIKGHFEKVSIQIEMFVCEEPIGVRFFGEQSCQRKILMTANRKIYAG